MSRSSNSKQQLKVYVSLLPSYSQNTKNVNILSFCPVILLSPFTNDMAGGLTLIETLDVGDCQLVSLCLTHSVRGDVDCISKYSIFCWTMKDM